MQDSTQGFIVRIWYEETGRENGIVVRRGSIEHVRSKKRMFFVKLEAILPFIEEIVCPPKGGAGQEE